MNPRIVVLPLAVLLVGAGLALRFGGGKPAPGPAADPGKAADPVPGHGDAAGGIPTGPYRIEPVRTREAPRTERFPARVRAPEPLYLYPSVPMTPVEKVPILEGASVRKGDLLVLFQAAGWERELAAAEKASDAARVTEAKLRLASLEVHAPADGLVYRVDARVGERPLLHNGDPLPIVTLFDWKQLAYEGTAPGSLAEILKAGAGVFVRTGADPRILPVHGKVERSGPPAADGGIPLEVRPVDPPSAVPGKDVPSEILVVVGMKSVLVVPGAAIRTVEGRPTVYVVLVTGELKARTAVVGLPVGDGLVEVSGVEKTESVAVWE